MNNRKIILHPCGYFDSNVLDILRGDLEQEFYCDSEITSCNIDISSYYNPSRRQYDANSIMQSISLKTDENVKIMGILRVDIFVPILTYIFGQAELAGSTGVASLYRLRNELYGLEINNNLLIERFRKVVLHEAGHLHGLIHCHNQVCIMRSSTYVEDIDQKERAFCLNCRTKLNLLLAPSLKT